MGADVSLFLCFPNRKNSSSSPSNEASTVEWGLSPVISSYAGVFRKIQPSRWVKGLSKYGTFSPFITAATQESVIGSYSFWRGGKFEESSLWSRAWKDRPVEEYSSFVMGRGWELLVITAQPPLEDTVTIESAFLACLLRPVWSLSRHSTWYVIPGLSEGNRSQLQTFAKEFRLFNSGDLPIKMYEWMSASLT